jgi:hypothetical protein
MRTDENGQPCPETLGEYRKMCAAIGGSDCKAVAFLDSKIGSDPEGDAAKVIVPDSQMRALLMPMLVG